MYENELKKQAVKIADEVEKLSIITTYEISVGLLKSLANRSLELVQEIARGRYDDLLRSSDEI